MSADDIGQAVRARDPALTYHRTPDRGFPADASVTVSTCITRAGVPAAAADTNRIVTEVLAHVRHGGWTQFGVMWTHVMREGDNGAMDYHTYEIGAW